MHLKPNAADNASTDHIYPLELSISLHKYDLEHHQIFTQVLKIDKDNSIKQVRHIECTEQNGPE